MNKTEAQRQLKIGYIFATVGLIVGFTSYPTIKEGFLLSGLILAYVFWGTYWGFRIVNQPVQKFFSGVFIMEKNIRQLIWKHILYKLTLFAITLMIAYFVGVLGGGIYKQITLMNVK